MIDGLIVQADDNDAYTMLEYWSEPISDWVLAWDIPNYDDYNGVNVYGMQTRPNPFDNTEQYTDFTPFLTNKKRIRGK